MFSEGKEGWKELAPLETKGVRDIKNGFEGEWWFVGSMAVRMGVGVVLDFTPPSPSRRRRFVSRRFLSSSVERFASEVSMRRGALRKENDEKEDDTPTGGVGLHSISSISVIFVPMEE